MTQFVIDMEDPQERWEELYAEIARIAERSAAEGLAAESSLAGPNRPGAIEVETSEPFDEFKQHYLRYWHLWS